MFLDHNNDKDEMIAELTNKEVSTVHELVTMLLDLKIHEEEYMHFLIGYVPIKRHAAAVEIFGSPVTNNLLKLAHTLNIFKSTVPTICISGINFGPNKLPMSLCNDDVAIVIADIFTSPKMRLFNNMIEVTSFIETKLHEDESCNIEDFSVIVGKRQNYSAWDWQNTIKKS